jgi:DNA-binding MarR family transcriptional regulator
MIDALLANKLAVAVTALNERIDAACEPLAPSAAATLLWLRHWSPRTATEMAPILGLTQPTAQRIVDGLLRDGLAARTKGVRGRAAPVQLTAKGRKLAETLQARRLAAFAQALAPLGVGDRRTLDRLLDTVLKPMVDGRAYARHICRFCDHGICDGARCPVGNAATELEQRP